MEIKLQIGYKTNDVAISATIMVFRDSQNLFRQV